jgi:hypothetical protein
MGGVKKKYATRPREKAGQLPKHIDWNQVEQMLIEGGNGVQVAACLGIHPETLYLRCEKEHGIGFSAYSQEKRAKGDLILHHAQFEKAVKGKNPTMQVWLGKQRLGQKENQSDLAITPETIAAFEALMSQLKNAQSARRISDNSKSEETKS